MRWQVRMWLMSIFGKRISPKKAERVFEPRPAANGA